ncbi:MAG: threonine-phosphate decarboxylase, partial [Phycisphaerae bacterium]|nr:threonine-phosphate decarboxylase [Phycisphaerae bacterium]
AHGLAARGPALFKQVPTAHAGDVHTAFARRGILLRQFADPPALRFGLPADETGWHRLEAALQTCIDRLADPT